MDGGSGFLLCQNNYGRTTQFINTIGAPADPDSVVAVVPAAAVVAVVARATAAPDSSGPRAPGSADFDH